MALFGLGKSKKEEVTPEILAISPEQIYESGVLELQDIIAPSALEINSNYVKLGEKMARTLFIFTYPRFLSVNWFSSVINLDRVFDISFFVHPIDTAGVLRQLQKKVAEVQSQLHEREKKGFVRDPILDTAYRDLEELRDRLQQATEKLFSFGLYLTIYEDTLDDLNRTETEIRSLLESKLVYAKSALFQQESGLISVMPFGSDKLAVHSKLNSSPISTMYPFVSFDLTANKGILYGINRHNNSLVLFDRYGLENYNSVIFGKAGGGKSILGTEPVLVKEKGKIRLTPIGLFVEKIIKKHGAIKIDSEMEGVIDPETEVYSFNKNLKGEWSRVSVAARKDAPDKFYRFTTRSGRKITTTGDHNMIVLKNGKIEAAKSSEVLVGEYVPIPRGIEASEQSFLTLNLLYELRHAKHIYILGGEYIVQENYAQLKNQTIDANYDCYLYKYKDGRRVPILYFLKILKALHRDVKNLPFGRLSIISTSGQKSLPPMFEAGKEFFKIAGYITAEGTVTGNSVLISNLDIEVLTDIKNSLSRMNILYYETGQGIVIAERVFVELIKHILGRHRSGKKQVPGELFALNRWTIASYLSAYFEGDGGVEHASITAISKSRELISGISYLLYYFGIVARISKRQKTVPSTGRKRAYWQISISGQKNLRSFAENVGFVSSRKRRLLANLLNRSGNTNVDVIPELENVFRELHDLFSFQLYDIPEISELKRGVRYPSPERLRNLTIRIEEKIHSFKMLKRRLDLLSELPTIQAIVDSAKYDNNINAILWQALGSSWPVMKNGAVLVGAKNVFKAMHVIGLEGMALDEVKDAVYNGFRDLGLSLSEYNSSLASAIVARPDGDTSYKYLQDAIGFLKNNYEEISKKLPRVEETVNQLKVFSESSLFWDDIIKIEELENKNRRHQYVYDLTVDNEVFVAGYGGMFVHNSYATKLEVLRSLMFDTDVIIIDPEREYEYLSEAVGGRYFNISLASKHHINPFDLPVPREDESSSDVFRSHVISLVGLFRIMLGGFTPAEDAIIDQAITETYASRDIHPESDFSKATPPLLTDMELILANLEGADTLLPRIRKFTQGTWREFINQPTNVDINKKLAVFSIRDMEEELRPVAIYLIIHYIWNAIRRELKRRLLVVDEAWWMMKNEDGASFLYGIAKRARKYFLGLTTVTQDVEDFLKSPYGVPIITNSSAQLLLKQSPTTIDLVQKTFSLTEEEKFLLLEADIGEGIFFAGLKHVAIKIIGSYTEDQIITSDPAQLLAIKKAKDEYASAQK